MSKVNMTTNNNCDGSGPHAGNETRILPTGGGSNAILCRQCFDREMAWRKQRNESVMHPVCNKYELPKWEELKVYKPE